MTSLSSPPVAKAVTAILQALPWSPPKRTLSERGEVDLLTTPATADFWNVYRSFRSTMRDLGISPKKMPDESWLVRWYRPLPAEEQQKAEQEVEQSRAMDADVDIPVPPGMVLRGYQKAGVAFAMARFGLRFDTELRQWV